MFNFKVRDVPTKEIDRTIEWLETIRKDCEFRIYQLKKRKSGNTRTSNWRQRRNALAEEIYRGNNELFETGDYDSRIKYIREHMECDEKRAAHVYDILRVWAKRKRRNNRDQEIAFLAKSGMNKSNIAEKFKISRQQVHNIIKKHKEENETFLKG